MTAFVILAAGLGTRFANLGETPKVLLRVPSGRTLLAENLSSGLRSGVASHAVVVTGHRADLVDAEVAAHEWSHAISTVHNPDYAKYGPVHSLWAAREAVARDDVIVLNGDTYYRPEAFLAIADRADPGFHLMYSRRGVEHDDVKVVLADGRIAAVGKNIPPHEAVGVSAGVFLARGASARAQFLSVLGDLARDERSGSRRIWHDVVHELADRASVLAVEVAHRDWVEVDTMADYSALRAALDSDPVGSRDDGVLP